MDLVTWLKKAQAVVIERSSACDECAWTCNVLRRSRLAHEDVMHRRSAQIPPELEWLFFVARRFS